MFVDFVVFFVWVLDLINLHHRNDLVEVKDLCKELFLKFILQTNETKSISWSEVYMLIGEVLPPFIASHFSLSWKMIIGILESLNLNNVKENVAILDLVVAVSRVWTRITTWTAVCNRTRFRSIDSFGFAARHVAHSWRFRDTAWIRTSWGSRAFWALCGALWRAWVASRTRSILTATASWTAARPVDKST